MSSGLGRLSMIFDEAAYIAADSAAGICKVFVDVGSDYAVDVVIEISSRSRGRVGNLVIDRTIN